jgi:hypothetical protein
MSRSKFARSLLASLFALSACALHAKDPNISSYFIGVDDRPLMIGGAYNGLPNPNVGRLTFLFAHTYQVTEGGGPSTNHYHSKGTFVYTGTNNGAGSTTIINSTSNYLPEGSIPPLALTLTSGGLLDGKLSAQFVSAPDTRSPFSQLTVQDTGKLASFASGTPEHFLFNSSRSDVNDPATGRWNTLLTGADVHLELVSRSAGLNIGITQDLSTTLQAFSAPGDDWHLEDSFGFTPLFWTEADAAPGLYTAQFKLTDEAGLWADSGVFEYRFEIAAVPEPSSAALWVGLGAFAYVARRRRRA